MTETEELELLIKTKLGIEQGDHIAITYIKYFLGLGSAIIPGQYGFNNTDVIETDLENYRQWLTTNLAELAIILNKTDV